MCVYIWEYPEIYKHRLWTRQIKMIGQRKPVRNAPRKWFKLGYDTGTLPLRLPMCLSTQTVLFFLLINTLLASLLSIFLNFFLQSLRAKALVTGLVLGSGAAEIQGSISDWEPKPRSKVLQAEVTWDHNEDHNEEIEYFTTLKFSAYSQSLPIINLLPVTIALTF